MFDNSPSGKVRFLALGELPTPGACLICGSGTREEGYVDLGVWLEYIGEGLMCATCVIEVGEKIDMMVPSEVEHLQGLASKLATENAFLEKELAEKNERLTTYDSLIAGVFANSGISTNDLGMDPGSRSTESTPISDSGESEVTESDSSDGRSNGSGEIKQDDGSSSGGDWKRALSL